MFLLDDKQARIKQEIIIKAMERIKEAQRAHEEAVQEALQVCPLNTTPRYNDCLGMGSVEFPHGSFLWHLSSLSLLPSITESLDGRGAQWPRGEKEDVYQQGAQGGAQDGEEDATIGRCYWSGILAMTGIISRNSSLRV